MSYCRFSSDGYQCDLYAYEDVAGRYTIHVAKRRHREPGPILGDFMRLNKAGDNWEKGVMESYWAAFRKWSKRQSKKSAKKRFIDITIPGAGETFSLDTLGAFRDKIVELRALGFKCDSLVVALINDEIKKRGEDYSPEPTDGIPENIPSGAIFDSQEGEVL